MAALCRSICVAVKVCSSCGISAPRVSTTFCMEAMTKICKMVMLVVQVDKHCSTSETQFELNFYNLCCPSGSIYASLLVRFVMLWHVS